VIGISGVAFSSAFVSIARFACILPQNYQENRARPLRLYTSHSTLRRSIAFRRKNKDGFHINVYAINSSLVHRSCGLIRTQLSRLRSINPACCLIIALFTNNLRARARVYKHQSRFFLQTRLALFVEETRCFEHMHLWPSEMKSGPREVIR
jgi:hypothetical protein